MDALTIAEAAQTTGWTARMLRYIESIGLVDASRSDAGYRLYGPEQLQRLRTLRELLTQHGIELAEVGFARRMQAEPALRAAVEQWLAETARRPDDVAPGEWLTFEQQKHERLLALTGATEHSS
jgi:DNA-binding transcriptional MerR regulator